MKHYIATVIMLLTLVTAVQAENRKTFRVPKFTVVIPAPYKETPADQLRPGELGVYVMKNPAGRGPDYKIIIQSMGLTLRMGREFREWRMPQEELNMGYQYGELTWRDRRVETMEGSGTQRGKDYASVVAVVPTMPVAAKITFSGGGADLMLLRKLAQHVISTIEAQSSLDLPKLAKEFEYIDLAEPSTSSARHTIPDLDMSIVIPGGYSELQPEHYPPGALKAFAKPARPNSVNLLIISIHDLGGTLGKGERPKTSELPQSDIGKMNQVVSSMMWKDKEIFTIHASLKDKKRNISVVAAHLPLLPSAAQIRVDGPFVELSKVRELTQELVNSVEGKSNWDPPATATTPGAIFTNLSDDRVILIIKGISRLTVFILFILGMVRLFRGKKRSKVT